MAVTKCIQLNQCGIEVKNRCEKQKHMMVFLYAVNTSILSKTCYTNHIYVKRPPVYKNQWLKVLLFHISTTYYKDHLSIKSRFLSHMGGLYVQVLLFIDIQE